MKFFYSLFLLFILTGCLEVEETDITGTIGVGSINPSPGEALPELGKDVDFTFENISWNMDNVSENEEIDIVVWFIELKDKNEVSKVGWTIATTFQATGNETIIFEMKSWNHTTFSDKPTTISLGLCKSKVLIKDVIKQCTEIASTETFKYQ